MADQMIEDGVRITTGGGVELQCTGVRYIETDGVRHNHEYIFRTVADLEAEAEVERKRVEAEEAAQAEAEQPTNPGEGAQA